MKMPRLLLLHILQRLHILRPDLKIACNYAYLQDVLSGIDEDNVVFGLTSPLHPIVIRPVESENYVGWLCL